MGNAGEDVEEAEALLMQASVLLARSSQGSGSDAAPASGSNTNDGAAEQPATSSLDFPEPAVVDGNHSFILADIHGGESSRPHTPSAHSTVSGSTEEDGRPAFAGFSGAPGTPRAGTPLATPRGATPLGTPRGTTPLPTLRGSTSLMSTGKQFALLLAK